MCFVRDAFPLRGHVVGLQPQSRTAVANLGSAVTPFDWKSRSRSHLRGLFRVKRPTHDPGKRPAEGISRERVSSGLEVEGSDTSPTPSFQVERPRRGGGGPHRLLQSGYFITLHIQQYPYWEEKYYFIPEIVVLTSY
jgi:hypothetical protein